MHSTSKTIAAKLHCRMLGIEYEKPKGLNPSPYGIIITYADNGSCGYSITKYGDIYRSSKFAPAPVYPKIQAAINAMNIYEKLEGYTVTVLEVN